jgi:hypothetical protein
VAISKKDASLASEQLGDKKSTKTAKSVAGSDLAQAKKSRSATSKKDASLASEQLRDAKSTKAQKSVAGSDLAQAKKAGGKKR